MRYSKELKSLHHAYISIVKPMILIQKELINIYPRFWDQFGIGDKYLKSKK